MSGKNFTFGDSKIALVVADMATRSKSVATWGNRINSRFAALAKCSSLGKEILYFGALLRDGMKRDINRSVESETEKTHLLNFLAAKYRDFNKSVKVKVK